MPILKIATFSDADDIAALVNACYRGDSSRLGWTTEADLLGGQRTDIREIKHLLEKQDSLFLLRISNEKLVASVHLEKENEAANLGMFSVRPDLQGKNIGKSLLFEAEELAKTKWQSKKVSLSVITLRNDLISYYERRGYRRTGELKPFPQGIEFGIPKVGGLRLEVLEKALF